MKYQQMTAARLSEVDRDSTMVIIPVAAVEQHGPHMPTGTDSILCTAVAEAIEERIQEKLLLLPTMWLGASAHHMRFGSTLDCELSNYINVLCDVGNSLIQDGFRRLFFLNGHGGNIDPLRVAARKLQSESADTQLVTGAYWNAADAERESILEGEHKFVGHACEFETSLMLHLKSEWVDTAQLEKAGELVDDVVDGYFVCRDMFQRTRAGFTGRPDLASAEKGKKLFESIVNNLVSTVKKLMAQPLGETYHDFFSNNET